MKTIKLLLIFALFTITFSAVAQEKITTDDKKQETNLESQEPKKQLNLTFEQQTPYREIIKRYAVIVRDVRKSILTPEEKKEKLKVVDLQREAEIKALLSPEQYQTHLELVELQKSRMIDMKKKAAPGSVNAK